MSLPSQRHLHRKSQSQRLREQLKEKIRKRTNQDPDPSIIRTRNRILFALQKMASPRGHTVYGLLPKAFKLLSSRNTEEQREGQELIANYAFQQIYQRCQKRFSEYSRSISFDDAFSTSLLLATPIINNPQRSVNFLARLNRSVDIAIQTIENKRQEDTNQKIANHPSKTQSSEMEQREEIEKYLRYLTPRQAEILCNYYGIGTSRLTEKELSEKNKAKVNPSRLKAILRERITTKTFSRVDTPDMKRQQIRLAKEKYRIKSRPLTRSEIEEIAGTGRSANYYEVLIAVLMKNGILVQRLRKKSQSSKK